ncbi:unnamed protein product [Penicillium olsonii]|nr:unnamed protein product [Penicillium olsonii]
MQRHFDRPRPYSLIRDYFLSDSPGTRQSPICRIGFAPLKCGQYSWPMSALSFVSDPT